MASRSLINHLLKLGSHEVLSPSPRYFRPLVVTRHYSQQERTAVASFVDKNSRLYRQQQQIDDGKEVVLNPFSRPNEEHQKMFIDELNPPLKKSFNLAAYVNSSKTLQELIKIGVSLYDIENIDINAAKKLVLLDFERDCVPYLRFLVDNGLKEKNLGRFISEFPCIFQVPIEDLVVRIKYLESKKFTKIQISNALNRSCQIISNDIKFLDHKLGLLQIEFALPGELVRNIASKYPPIIKLPGEQYKLVNFTLSEEFGFTKREISTLLKEQPQLLDILRPKLIERIDLIHNTIGLSHETILKFPKLITGPKFDIRHRFLYLQKLKRNQFDPREPLYVPPSALYNGSDEDFCRKYAKTSLEDYKLFLKSH